MEGIHVISVPSVLVRAEDHHPVLGTMDKSSFFDIGTKHTKAQAIIKVKSSTSIPSKYQEFSDVFEKQNYRSEIARART